MKFYLSSAKDLEPYDDLQRNKLMQKYLREIKETGVQVTFEKESEYYQHIVINIPSMKALAQIMEEVGEDLIIEQDDIEDTKYPTLCIYDDYIE